MAGIYWGASYYFSWSSSVFQGPVCRSSLKFVQPRFCGANMLAWGTNMMDITTVAGLLIKGEVQGFAGIQLSTDPCLGRFSRPYVIRLG